MIKSIYWYWLVPRGKTRVLVHRIAWKIQVDNISPYGILAVTFTNKAAREMRERIDSLLGISLRGMWVGTFHGLGSSPTKAHWRDAKLPENFQILDSDDQLRLVKRVMRAMDLDEQRWPPKQAQWWINSQKDEGLRAAHIQESGDPFLATMLRIYRQYELLCEQLGVIDFAECYCGYWNYGAITWRCWPITNSVLGIFWTNFKIPMRCNTHGLDCWRVAIAVLPLWVMMISRSMVGAVPKLKISLSFERDFAATETIKLEQNYRSTSEYS